MQVEQNQQLNSRVGFLEEEPKTEDAAEGAEQSLSDETMLLDPVPENAQPEPLPDNAPAAPSARKRRQSRK